MGTEKREAGRRRRSGSADDQEQRSVGQLIDRLAELGWKAQGPRKDYGEDFLVQIWDEGQSTGLSFYVQLKSVRDAELRKGKRKPDALKYRLEVKDLEHWEVQTPLVVLLIWDVEKRQGYWETMPRIVEALEKKGKGWRKKGTVTVEVPASQGTDDAGIWPLRRSIADYWYPLVVGTRPVRLDFSFPNTEAGEAMSSLLKDRIRRGEGIVFDDKTMPNIEIPAQLRRLYGLPKAPDRMVVVPKQATRAMPPVRVELQSQSGTAAMSHVEFRCTTRGGKVLEISNEHQEMPWHFIWKRNESDEAMTFTFRQARIGRTVSEARDAAAFLLVASSPGGRLRIRDPRTQEVIFERVVPWLGEWHELAKARLALLDKLSYLEPRIERYGAVRLDKGITPDDAVAIETMYKICREGSLRQVQNISATVAPDAVEPSWDGDITIHAEHRISILGLEIPTGQVVATVEERERFIAAARAAIDEARARQQPATFHVEGLSVVTRFLDWQPFPHDRLYDIAASQSGYFTLAQAREAGFSSAEELEIKERVEPHGGNVFRLVQFPSIEENEDHIVTWLLTDKKAIFSHDTALALHELSDILPTRQHITLPPDWSLPEGIELPTHVVVHRGIVDPSEITWMGPVPFTKPYKTLRDCIEDDLTPDLLEQAISEARTRGLISRADAQALQASRAKSA